MILGSNLQARLALTRRPEWRVALLFDNERSQKITDVFLKFPNKTAAFNFLKTSSSSHCIPHKIRRNVTKRSNTLCLTPNH